MSRRRKQKKGPSPLFAVCLLLVGAWVAARGLLGGGVVADPLALGNQGSADGAVPDEATGGQDTDAESVPFVDLLHAFGSYQRGREVRLAFAAFEYPSFWAAPSGESGAAFGRWVGEDPPLLRLGVVMVSEGARRAVLGGRVVGVGETFDACKVLTIDPGVVTVEWSGRRLTYDLQDESPREFRAEQAQRRAEQADATDAGPNAEAAGKAADAIPESPKETRR